MIDLHLLRKYPNRVREGIIKKDPQFNVDLLIDLDQKVRLLLVEAESLQQQKNDLTGQVKGKVAQDIRDASIALGKEIKEKEAYLVTLKKEFDALYYACPNIPDDDVPPGDKSANVVVRQEKEKPEFSFTVKNHIALGESLGWFDFKAASTITGNNFVLYQRDAVRLLYALSLFMIRNNIQHGYEPIIPASIVNEKSLEGAGTFPKFKDQVYAITGENFYLTPTAEVNLANRFRDHIFQQDELPMRMTAWTSCFRKEAGAYGMHERGLIRTHQFEKVELYTICDPEHSSNELDYMIACAENILKKLDLHYRISLLAAQDCSFQSAKTYDIEVWLPGQKEYYEVSSVSNCTDFQARRCRIRYRDGKKVHLAHTLNASSLALPRLIVALMETYQQEDGTIAIPDCIKQDGIFDYVGQ